ncbi:nucleotidyl transferase AbiEii/AbiGii toxin family protein [Hydrogenophaga sp. 2FB]|uniref:nucleotidyl transferase AbiEii/AbiGii toxin family protein n=1 Tax=Hydrogenophaga sp. 2FB TaxID=2502187 RepID=UPI0010F8A7AF|nr:nucleotidyl transferase AbiEii/AbiGii toxin family protein [Hydrogenophaga sp. 2FB]
MLLMNRCFFGGGTAIALSHGEYREAIVIDLICSSVDGYREVRQSVNVLDQAWLFKQPVQLVRVPRVDQYGIRLAAAVDQVPVKIEIVFEGRIDLKDPLPEDVIEGVWSLTQEDLVATKLMANADRYADESVMSRDLIDLAMLSPDGRLVGAGVAKARRAYGASIDKAFIKGRELLLHREGHLVKCMNAMQMTMVPDVLREKILSLHLDPFDQRQKPEKALRPAKPVKPR